MLLFPRKKHFVKCISFRYFEFSPLNLPLKSKITLSENELVYVSDTPIRAAANRIVFDIIGSLTAGKI